ncbi:hypothetical protein BV25DRAFT_1919332 [Artomyces pyxidatus]|uniref:Uncharacterized protein n=1 Tax=Artomyces pyxidatus TaxID=48021 RepID=A0ACB8SRC2_9AGAM|nr:hypothetical protein BV25DRAFT_1919332 [Artomyces pyxidatus]
MLFRVPPTGTNACAVTWSGPPVEEKRNVDLETKGDISQIEVWSVIAPTPVPEVVSHVRFQQVHFPKLGFELVRRQIQ